MEVSNDDSILTVASGNTVSFWNTARLEKLPLTYYFDLFFTKICFFLSFEKIKEYQVPSTVHSASLHPSRSVFVCGGEDFKMYKMDYQTGQEIESFKGTQTDKSYFSISFT